MSEPTPRPVPPSPSPSDDVERFAQGLRRAWGRPSPDPAALGRLRTALAAASSRRPASSWLWPLGAGLALPLAAVALLWIAPNTRPGPAVDAPAAQIGAALSDALAWVDGNPLENLTPSTSAAAEDDFTSALPHDYVALAAWLAPPDSTLTAPTSPPTQGPARRP